MKRNIENTAKFTEAMHNETLELDYKWKIWKEDFLKISDQHAPLRTIRMKPNNRNWLTADILKAMNNRDHMKNTASSTNDPTQWEEYKRLRNQVTRSIQKAKRTHYKGLVQKKQNNTKFWKELTKLIPKKVNMASIPKSLTLDELNTFFSEIGSKTIFEVEQKKKKIGIPWKGQDCIYSFEFQQIEEDDIITNLEKLKLTTNTDILGIDCKLLRLSSTVIQKTLIQRSPDMIGHVPL
jgi:hypothetical protein